MSTDFEYVIVIRRLRVQYEKYFTSSEIFPYNIFRAFRRGKYTEKSGTSKIFPYCTSKCLITGLSWPKKCSANNFNFSCPVCCFFFVFHLLPVSNFFLFECRTFEFLNIRTFECQKTFKDPEPKHFLKKLQKSRTSGSISECFCLVLGLVTLCCLEFKYIQRIHPSRPCFTRLRKTNWRTLWWRFHGKLFTTFTMRWVDMFCLDYVNRPIVKEKSSWTFRHETGRMEIIITDRDNRFFREVISRILKVEVIHI